MPYITRYDDISVLPLSVRTQNCLRRADIHTIGAMLDYPADEFIHIRNMGAKSNDEIQGYIQLLIDGTGEYVLLETGENPLGTASPTDEISGEANTTTIFLDDTGAVVEDIPVKALPLSVRARNCLALGGYKFASQLIGLTYDNLMSINKMGKKTVEEVLEYISSISITQASCPNNAAGDSFFDHLASELFTAYGEEKCVWLRELVTIKTQYPDALGETLIYHLYDNAFVRGTTKAKILRLIEESGNEISKASLAGKLPQHLSNTTILEEILLELEAASAVEIGEIMIRRQYPSIVEFAARIQDKRRREVVQGKLAGKTLQEIGAQYNITRERARQLMQDGLQQKPYLREDKYIYLYDHYDFSLEDFILAYDEPHETYYYLEMISQITRAKRKPLEEILTDTAIAPEYRKKAERAIYKKYVSIDGIRVKMTRPDLIKHYIKINCKSLTKFDDFVSAYNLWLDSLGFGEDPTLTIEARTYENILNQCYYVLWNQWRSFRYYNISERDYDELLSTLNFDQYEDVEISSLKLYRDYPELMDQYDIRDEYELHNLLKKIWPNPDGKVNFKKMPTIEIGTANRSNQIFSLLLQYAPISAEEFANRYEDTYGIKGTTVLANYMSEFDPYYFNGIYSVCSNNLSFDQFSRMQSVLSDDFYLLSEVKRLYLREFPSADPANINAYTLKALGFRVYTGYSGYIIRNTYSSASAYFNHMLTSEDLVDTRDKNNTLCYIKNFTTELYDLRAKYDIIEYLPLRYINIRRLNSLGITKELFRDYCSRVASLYEKGEYFSTKSLYQDGFSHVLDDLGFDEWFYSSILIEGRDHFSSQRVGGTRILLRGKSQVTLGNMLIWLLEKTGKINLHDLIDLLNDRYGISLPKEKLVEIIRGTDLYYDTIMEAVYIDYDTYFEEI